MKKRLSEHEIIDYVDGTLDVAELAAVEEYLLSHAEDAELVASMKLAKESLQAWDAAEPVRVSANFWPNLRDKLPESPRRSWLRRAGAQISAWMAPSHSPWRLSIPVAIVAAFIALATFWFSPKKAVRPIIAEPKTEITRDEEDFIKRSLVRHKAYISSSPLSGSPAVPATVGRSNEDGDNEDDDNDKEPTR